MKNYLFYSHGCVNEDTSGSSWSCGTLEIWVTGDCEVSDLVTGNWTLVHNTYVQGSASSLRLSRLHTCWENMKQNFRTRIRWLSRTLDWQWVLRKPRVNLLWGFYCQKIFSETALLGYIQSNNLYSWFWAYKGYINLGG